MTKLKIPDPIWIVDNAALKSACAKWMQEPFIAVDTEFMRTTTFYPEAGLVQIASSDGSYLIDPLTITDWQPFAELLTHPLVVKVFHACLEDLEVCRCLTGVLPTPLADTQVAAALASIGGGMGFQRLLEEVLGLHLPKEETRSNWMLRPLREEQIRYAVADVHYLFKLYPKLMARLKELGRQHWLSEDCERMLLQAEKADQASNYYRRIKLAWKLRAQELMILQQVSFWREKQARALNVPRGKVVDDTTLWNIARFKASNNDQLAKAGVPSAIIREHGSELIKLVKEVLALDKKLLPKEMDKPLSIHAGLWFKEIKDITAAKAEALNMPADLLVKKQALESLLRSGYPRGPYRLPELLSGWRKAEIGDALADKLQHLSNQWFVEQKQKVDDNDVQA